MLPLLQRASLSHNPWSEISGAGHYEIIRPPFPLQFHERSRAELKTYRDWFHEIIPARIAELTKAVKGTAGFERWVPDWSPSSLELLGEWFESQVKTRKKRAEEIEEMRRTLPYPIDIPEEQLTEKTFSLAMDVGMYFSQVFTRNIAGTGWDHPLSAKLLADYGQPRIVGLGKVPLNPIRVAVVMAYGISRGKRARLRELYDLWAKEAATGK